MRIRAFGLIGCLMALPCWGAQVRDCMVGGSSFAGHDFLLEVSNDELLDSPAWTPDSGKETPASAGQVVRVAIAEFSQFVQDPKAWTLREIDLVSFCGERWGWQLRWYPNDRGSEDYVTIVVLVSGVVVPMSRLKAW